MTAPFLLGLTGSIGMGKSTTAAMFADEGIPVWDADGAVHALYAKSGAAVKPLAALCPDALVDGQIDRGRLKDWIANDPTALARIEAVVHPLVAAHRAGFVACAKALDTVIVVLDIPLLFETGAEKAMDATLVVSAPPEVQRARVMARPGMTDALFEQIRARQMPDAEKRGRATYVIETLTPDTARTAVRRLLADLRQTHA
ncbi:MAG: dephospho-CoA kinase [Albidovulum sp.]